MFYVGQKVVCVDDTPMGPRSRLDGLRKGRVYTVRDVMTLGGRLQVRVSEILRPVRWSPKNGHMLDLPYYASRFRPAVSRKTDISIFQKILREATEKANV